MAGLNQVLLVGNLGKDPEISTIPSGAVVAKFSLATSESFTDKTTGVKQDKTEWHNIIVWNKQAENCAEYLRKGSKALVEGEIQYSSYEKDGVKKYSTEIVANNVQFLDRKGQDASSQPQMAAAHSVPSFDVSSEEIPF